MLSGEGGIAFPEPPGAWLGEVNPRWLEVEVPSSVVKDREKTLL
jgi:hypothetical protein